MSEEVHDRRRRGAHATLLPSGGAAPRTVGLGIYPDYANVRELRKEKRAAAGPPFLARTSTRSRLLPLPALAAEARSEEEGAEQDELDTEGP